MTITVSDPAELGFDPDRLARIDAHLKSKYLDGGRFPHTLLLVGRGDEVAHLSVQGTAREGEPLKPDALFRIASMTKPITSVGFMMLVEEGKAALSDPVVKHIPEWKDQGVFVSGGGNMPFASRPPASSMRIIDLLRHTSGLTYSFQERSNIDAAYRKLCFERFDSGDLDSFVTHLAGIPTEFDPGTGWNYSVSTDVVGLVIQRLSGMRLDDYLRTRILEPLGMIDTHFEVLASKVDRLPDCYAWDAKTRMRMYDKGADSAWAKPPKLLSGGGGLVSTVADYHRFCRMLLNGGSLDGATLLSPKTIELMTMNHLPGGGDLTQHSRSMFSEAENGGAGFGLGFGVTIDVARSMLPGSVGEYYWGGIFSTGFFIDPVEQIIMIFMTQLTPSNSYPVRREIKTMLYSALTG